MLANQSRQKELRRLYGTDTLEEFRSRFGLSRYLQWWVARIGARIAKLEVEQYLLLHRDRVRPPRDNVDTALSFRVIGHREIAEHAGTRHDLDHDFLDQRDSRRDICFGAFQDRELAAYGWFTRFPHDLRLPENMAYTFKAFTLPEFRGMGLQASIKRAALDHFDQFNVNRFLTIVNWINWPSQRACLRVGYRSLGHTVSVRIGGKDIEHRSKAIQRIGILPSTRDQWQGDDGTWNDRSTGTAAMHNRLKPRIAESAATFSS
ncbi:MAG: hypothetical protein O3A00_25980 [Planctomycetota bacterium]|nr:hypothetical protein [Planctomycetota bacterium]